MTTSDTTTTALAEQVVTDSTTAPPISIFDHAVLKIIEETGRPEHEAIAGLRFIEEMAAQARTGARCGTKGTHHLTHTEMDTLGYAVMDSIMEHNATAAPSSAHAAVQAHVLGSNEYALTHNNPTGRKQDCTVTVDVGFVS